MNSSKKILQAREIEFAYSGQEPILNKISLDIEAGKFLAILGVNG